MPADKLNRCVAFATMHVVVLTNDETREHLQLPAAGGGARARA